ncbi:hypothetical protein FOVSG1_014150 [Fusarium oxysporum f. sp. vasinfectum]
MLLLIVSLRKTPLIARQSLEYPIAPGARLYLPLDSTILRNLTMCLGNICILPKIPLFILDQNPRGRMWLNENDSRYLFIIWLKSLQLNLNIKKKKKQKKRAGVGSLTIKRAAFATDQSLSLNSLLRLRKLSISQGKGNCHNNKNVRLGRVSLRMQSLDPPPQVILPLCSKRP